VNWEKFDLHIENLVPGITLLAIIVVGWPSVLGPLANQKVIIAAAFVAASYMVGAIANLLARLLLEYVCRKTLRRRFLMFFVGERLELSKRPTRKAVDDRLSEVIDAAMSCGNVRAEAEVEKRRQTGRVLRSSLVPLLLSIWVIGRHLHLLAGQRVAYGLLAYLALLLLYAYSEVAVYQGGHRGLRLKRAASGAPGGSALPNEAAPSPQNTLSKEEPAAAT
jgi:hypothetical protein